MAFGSPNTSFGGAYRPTSRPSGGAGLGGNRPARSGGAGLTGNKRPPKPSAGKNPGQNKGAGKNKGGGNKGGKGSGFNNPLYQPSQTLSGKSLWQAANALAQSQTKGPLAELASQMATQDQQGAAAEKLTSGYFNQLGQMVNQSNAQQQQIASGLNSQLQGIGQNTQSQLQGIGQNATDSLAKYAPGTATGLSDPALQGLATEIGRQQGLAAQDAGASRAFGATQGANYQGLGASNLGTFSLRGQERLGNIAQATRLAEEPLNAKVANLQASTGALRGSALERLRQQEIVNSISKQGLGIKQQANVLAGQRNAITAQNNAANQKLKAKEIAITGGKAAFEQSLAPGSPAWARVQSAQGKAFDSNPNAVGSPAWARVQAAAARRTGGGGGSKPLTTLENNAWHTKLTTVMQLIRDGNSKNVSGAQIRANLADGANPSKRSYDNTLITAAFQMIGGGAVSPGVAKALKGLGVNLGALGIKTSVLGGVNLNLGNLFG